MFESLAESLLKSILGIAIFGVLFVSWFTYTEVFIIKAICTWCAICLAIRLAKAPPTAAPSRSWADFLKGRPAPKPGPRIP